MTDAKNTVADDTRAEDMTTIVPAEAILEAEVTAMTGVKSLAQVEVTQAATATMTARAAATAMTGVRTPVQAEATQAVMTTTTVRQGAAMEATPEGTADQVTTEANTLLVRPTGAAVAMVVPRMIFRVQPSTLRASLETATTTTFSAMSSVCCPARKTSLRMKM
jgi:hypothetical protein